MNAKQTGPAGTVKTPFGTAVLRGAIALAVAAMLAGCAGSWSHPSKTPEEARADETQCSQEAEQDSLLRAGRTRSEFGAPPGAPTAGSLGPSPMQMKDRDSVTQDFRSGMDICMESKGYTKGKPKR
jgi:hypothetical protein